MDAKEGSNPLKLKLRTPYRSIRDLPESSLPTFTVLTGLNGSGKSHFLEALQGGQIQVEGIEISRILRYGITDFTPKVEENASPTAQYQQRRNALDGIITAFEKWRKESATWFPETHYNREGKLSSLGFLADANEAELAAAMAEGSKNPANKDPRHFSRAAKQILSSRLELKSRIGNALSPYSRARNFLEKRAGELGISFYELSNADLLEALPFLYGSDTFLKFRIAEWFAGYHAEFEYNRFNRYCDRELNERDRPWLADEDFQKKFGPPPWDVLNRVLNQAGIRFRFNKPTAKIDNLISGFRLVLSDPETDTEIPLINLSSGERVLMAVTLLLHQSQSEGSFAALPKLLLLDEADASLHPSLTRVLISILNDVFVGQYGMNVILTTHSPSTVALAPYDSVYELVRSPRSLRKVTPSQATQILSSGFITLTPADRIVFVESSTDAEYYQQVFAALLQMNRIPQGQSLKFISVTKSDDESVGGGKEQVQNWVVKLASVGESRFFGLIDQDGNEQSGERLRVLRRYSVENYIFDPVTVCTFLIAYGFNEFVPQPLTLRRSSDAVCGLDEPQLQQLMNAFYEWLANLQNMSHTLSANRIRVAYANGHMLEIPEWWIKTKGHELVTVLRAALNSYAKSKGAQAIVLTKYTNWIDFQVRSCPELIPNDLAEIMKSIQTHP